MLQRKKKIKQGQKSCRSQLQRVERREREFSWSWKAKYGRCEISIICVWRNQTLVTNNVWMFFRLLPCLESIKTLFCIPELNFGVLNFIKICSYKPEWCYWFFFLVLIGIEVHLLSSVWKLFCGIYRLLVFEWQTEKWTVWFLPSFLNQFLFRHCFSEHRFYYHIFIFSR